MKRIVILLLCVLMALPMITIAQNSGNETTTTKCTVSAELQKILEEDAPLQNAINWVNPDRALDLSDDFRQEIEESDAFCFNFEEGVMLLWGKQFETGLMIWGPGLTNSFLSEVKKGNIIIKRTRFRPKSTAIVPTPIGDIDPSCQKGTFFYRVTIKR